MCVFEMAPPVLKEGGLQLANGARNRGKERKVTVAFVAWIRAEFIVVGSATLGDRRFTGALKSGRIAVKAHGA